jgi:hypothetical protein
MGMMSFVATAAPTLFFAQHGEPKLPFSVATLSSLPLAVSISCFSVLLVMASLGRSAGARPFQSVSTTSYLVSGLAAATAFVMQLTAAVAPAPFWPSASTTLLFFGSAFLYYLGLEHSDEERHGAIPVSPFSNV